MRIVTGSNLENAERQKLSTHQKALKINLDPEKVLELMEITMRNLLVAGAIDLSDFLARADVLAATGKAVLISNYFEYYRLAVYLARYTNEPIAVTMGAGSLQDLFGEQYYSGLGEHGAAGDCGGHQTPQLFRPSDARRESGRRRVKTVTLSYALC